MTIAGNPYNMPRKPEKPRRVVGGLRLAAKDWPNTLGWAGRAMLDIAEREAPADIMIEALEWATKGQTRRSALEVGRITAAVQGPAPRSIEVVVDFPMLTPSEWSRVLDTLADQASHAADILSGSVNEGIEEAFASRGVSLIPPAIGPERITSTLGARGANNGGGWTVYSCCAWLIAAQMVDREPVKLFELRGLPLDDLLGELRMRRTNPGAGDDRPPMPGTVAAHEGVERCRAPLDEQLDGFWTAGPALSEVQTPIRPPEVSHPLLRRLGPSPFDKGKFPLAGLLATCYDLISESAIRLDQQEAEESAADVVESEDD